MLPTTRPSLAAGALALALVPALWAQAPDPEIGRRLDQLEKGQQRIQQQLDELKTMLQSQARAAAPSAPAGPNVVGLELDLGNNPIKGERTAGLVLVEFTDYQ